MYKKLLVAPLVLSLALSTVAPYFAQANESETTESVEQINIFADAGEKVDFDLLYKGELSSYKAMFDVAYIKEIENNQYEITMKIPEMLTTFMIDSKVLTPVTKDGGFNIFKFTTSTLTNIPLYIEYNVGFYVGKHTMSIDMKYGHIMPAISEENILVTSYDNVFTNVSSRYDGEKYFISMDVTDNVSSITIDDNNIQSVKKNDISTVQLALSDIEKEQSVTVNFNDGTSKNITLDFTPSISEIKANLDQVLKAGKEISSDTFEAIMNRLSYTKENTIKNKKALKLAELELEKINDMSKYEIEAAADLQTHSKYVNQQQVIQAYRAIYTNLVNQSLAQLTYKESESIKNAEDLKNAETQLANAKAEIDAANAAGITEKEYSTQNEQYVAQTTEITSYKTRYKEKVSNTLKQLSYTTKGSIKTHNNLNEAQKQVTEVTNAVTEAEKMGLTTKEISSIVGYTNLSQQKNIISSGVSVVPVISFAGLATANYANSFTNVIYKKSGDDYEVSMNVDKLFTTFKVNGEAITLTSTGDIQKATFKMKDIESNPTITISYSVEGVTKSHNFKFDFTPSIAEVEQDISNAIQNLTYTKSNQITNAESYKAAVKELDYIEKAVEYEINDEKVNLELLSKEQYKNQKQEINTYAEPFINALTSQIDKLTYKDSAIIKNTEDLIKAKVELNEVQEKIKLATTAGLTEKKELAALEVYKDILAQKAAIDSYVELVVKDAKDKINALKYTKSDSIKTMQDLENVKTQLRDVEEAIKLATDVGISEQDVFATLEQYKNIALQQAVLNLYNQSITTKDNVIVKSVVSVSDEIEKEKALKTQEIFEEVLGETAGPIIHLNEELNVFEITLPFNITPDIKEIWINDKKVYPVANTVSPALLKAKALGTETAITFASTSLSENKIVVKKAQIDENGEEKTDKEGNVVLEEFEAASSFVIEETTDDSNNNTENSTGTENNGNSTNEGSTNSNNENNTVEEAKEQPISYVFYYKGQESSYGSMFGSATSKKLENGQYEIKLAVPNMISSFTVEGKSPEVVSNSSSMKIVKFTIPSLTSTVDIHIEYFIEDMNFTGSHDMQIGFGQVSSGSSSNEEANKEQDKNEGTNQGTDQGTNPDTNEDADNETALIPGEYTVDTLLSNIIGNIQNYISINQSSSVSVNSEGGYDVSLPIENMDLVQSVEVNGAIVYTKTVLQKFVSFFKNLSTTEVLNFTTKKLTGNEIKIVTTDGASHSAKLTFMNAIKEDKVEGNTDVDIDPEQKEEPKDEETNDQVKEEPVKETPVKEKATLTAKPKKVTVTNKKGGADTVAVYGASKGQIVKVYNAKGKVIAKQTAKSATVKFTKLNLGKNAGAIFVTLQTTKQLESKKLKVAFQKEPVSTKIKSTSITIKNNKAKSDIVTISGTVKGDVIYIYNAKGKQIKKVKATNKKTVIKIAQLGKKSGTIQVARLQSNKHLSSKTVKKFNKEK